MWSWLLANWEAVVAFIASPALLKLYQRLKWNGKNSEIGRLSERVSQQDKRISALEKESDDWRESAWKWYVKYSEMRLEVYRLMVEHDMPQESIELFMVKTEVTVFP